MLGPPKCALNALAASSKKRDGICMLTLLALCNILYIFRQKYYLVKFTKHYGIALKICFFPSMLKLGQMKVRGQHTTCIY